MSKLFVDEIVHQSSQGSGTITIGASGETINVVGTLQNNGSAVGGTNTPAFHVRLSTEPTISNNVTTKVQFDTEIFDSNGCYDNATNYRFTPTTAGKYYIYLGITGSTGDQQQFTVDIYKNGSRLNFHRARGSGTSNMSAFTAGIIDFNGSTDYVEGFVTHEFGSNSNLLGAAGTDYTFFGGYKIIE